MYRKSLVFCVLFILWSVETHAAQDPAVIHLKTLSPRLANQAAMSAFYNCTKQGFNVAVSVVARDGNLLAFIRSPLAGPHTVEVSQRKAYTAATYQTPTSQMMQREHLKFSPGVLLLGGGVPINIGGHFYGAIAVSGAPAEKVSGDIDEKCAIAGINTIQEEVEFAE